MYEGSVSNPTSFEYSEPTEDSSEDSTLINRALPNDELQGYNVYGQPIELPRELEPGERLQQYLELQRNPELLFTRLVDKNTGQTRSLTKEQYEKLNALITRNRTFSNINLTERPELKFIDEVIRMSIYENNLPSRSQFCRKQELKRTAYFARLIAQGKLDPDDVDGYKRLLREKLEREARNADVWEFAERPIQYQSQALAEHYQLRRAPAPKVELPTTYESYNPPDEYLADGAAKARCLRTLRPATAQLVVERYNRQLDLFESVRHYNRDAFKGTSDEFLQEQLRAIAKLRLRPYPTFCDIVIRSHMGRVNAVDISPNGKFVASGGRDGILRIFELRTGKLLKQIVLVKHSAMDQTLDKYYGHEINCLKFCPNDKVCIVACGVGTQVAFVNAKLSMGHNLQETLLATQNLLNPDVQKVRPCRGWRWECLQGVVENLGGEGEENVVRNQERRDEDFDQENVDDPRFDRIRFQLNHGGRPDNVTVYTSLNTDVLLRIHSPNVINQVDFHPGGDYLLTLSNVHQRRTNLAIHRLSRGQSSAPFNRALPVQAAIFNRRYPSLVVFEQTSGFGFNLKALQREAVFQPHVKQVQKCAYNLASGDLVVCGSLGGVALFKSCAGPAPDSKNYFSSIQTACIDARDNLVAVGGEDGII